MNKDHKSELAGFGEKALIAFLDAHRAREEALRISREVVRTSANAIRATHRGEFDQARSLLEDASGLVGQIKDRLFGHPASSTQVTSRMPIKSTLRLRQRWRSPKAQPCQGPTVLGLVQHRT